MRLVPLIAAALLGLGSAAAAEPTVTLKLGDQKGGERALLEAAGELDHLPYRVEWSEFAAAAPLLEALNAGAVDSGPVGDAPLVFALAAGAEIKAIGVNHSNPEATAIIALPGSALTDAASLKGHRIATGRGSIGHYQVLAALRSAGLTTRDIDLVFLAPGDAKAALSTGQIDAWSTWEPYTALEEVTDHAKLVVSGTGLSSGLSYQVATQGATRDKHAALDDLLQRLYRAQRWSLAHVDDYSKRLAELTGVPEPAAHLSFARRQQTWVPVDDTIAAAQQLVADTYADAGIIPRRFDVKPSFDRSFTPPLRQTAQP